MGGAASCKFWPVFAYSNGYWEVYRRFQGVFFGWEEGGWEEGVMWGKFSMEEFFIGEEDSHKGGAAFSGII